MMMFISCIAFIHGDLFFSKTAADIHSDGSQNSSLLLFLSLAVHSTTLNNVAFDSSSLLNFFNEKRRRSFLLGNLKQLGFFNEHIAVHSQSTSSRYNCCVYFLKIGFFRTAPAISLYVRQQSILPSDTNPSWGVFTFVRLGYSTVTWTWVFFSSGSRAGIGEAGPTTPAKATGRFLSLQGVDVRVLGHWSTDVLFGDVVLSSSISTDVTDALQSSKATRFVACSWESLIWFEEGFGTGNETAEHFFDWTISWIELFTSWRLFNNALHFFSAQRQFLPMYVELISTLHSKDSSSSRTLKELPLRLSTRCLSVFFTMSMPQRTQELIVKISHHIIVAN